MSSSCWPTHGITDRELAVAKGNLRAEMLLSGEDSGARMGRIGASMLLHGEVQNIDEVLARVEAVGRDEVLAAGPGAGRGAPHAQRRGPVRRGRLCDHVASLAGRLGFSQCARSVWSEPAAGWAVRSAWP